MGGMTDQSGDPTRQFRAEPGATDPDATAAELPQVDGTRVDGTPVAGDDARWSARAAVRPPGPAAPTPTQQWEREPYGEDPYHGRSWLRPVLIALAVLLIIALLGTGVWLIMRNTSAAPGPAASPTAVSSAPATTAAPTKATTTTAPTSAAPTLVTVPDGLVGGTEANARNVLGALGLKVRTVQRVSPTAEPGTVLTIEPPAGTQVPAGTTVVLLVATAPAKPPPPPTSPSPSSSVHG
jgi:hypothetical protein